MRILFVGDIVGTPGVSFLRKALPLLVPREGIDLVIANAAQTSDSDAVRVCRDIAHAIEQQLNYPSEIKVTVVRETRAVEYAR